MWHARTLGLSIALCALALACAKKGGAPEPETARNAPTAPRESVVARPMQTSPDVARQTAEPTPAWGATPETAPIQPAPVESTEAPIALTDEQIVHITETVNESEIEQARLAQRKAKSERVKKFASQMLSAHTKAKIEGESLAKEAQLSVAESKVAADVEGKTEQQLELLKSADAADFDRTYTEGQIVQHQAALDLLTKQLIPNAHHPELKAQLQEERSMVEHHLDEARNIHLSLLQAARDEASEAQGTPRAAETKP